MAINAIDNKIYTYDDYTAPKVYSFDDKIKVNIYTDLYMDFKALDLS